MSTQVILAGVLGLVVVGALMVGILARVRARRVAATQGIALAERSRSADVLHGTVREQAARIRDLEAQLKATQGDIERRLAVVVAAERRAAAADRAGRDSELHAAREVADALRAEATTEREAGARARAALEAELESTRAALRRVETEWADLHTEIAALRSDGDARVNELVVTQDTLLADLSAERSNAAAVEASLRVEIAELREQHAAAESALRGEIVEARDQAVAAVSERDAYAREYAVQYSRAESAARLAVERRNGVDLVRRIWEYLHPEGEGAAPSVTSQDAASQAATSAQASKHPTEYPEWLTSPAVADIEMPVRQQTEGLADAPPAPSEGDEDTAEMPSAADAPDADAPEAAAEGHAADQAPETPAEGLADVGANGTADMVADVGGADVGVMLHTLPANVRKPVSVMREGETLLVVCDDGAVWERGPSGWREAAPLPGSRSDAVHRFQEDVEHRPRTHSR
jgi:hypothetical protein